MSILASGNSVSGFTSIQGTWDILTGLYGGNSLTQLKPRVNTVYAPNSSGNMNPVSDLVYLGILPVQPNDVVRYPVVPDGGYSFNGELSPNAVDKLFTDTGKLSQDKIFQFFNIRDSSQTGYIDKLAAKVNAPDDPNSGFGISDTTVLIAAVLVGYLLIK